MATKRKQYRSKYAGKVKISKESDVIMTPPHIAQLMAKLANPQPNSVILDPTCGDGNLLVACPQGKLIGVEQEEKPFSNCRKKLPGAHLYFGDSLAHEEIIRSHEPTIVLTNPPYSEYEKENVSLANIFMDFGLNCLQTGGILIGLVPISCGISQHAYKTKLMDQHTLKAVMTMPKDLFGTEAHPETLLMIWEAYRPHDITKPVWFASWQDDGVKSRKKSQETIPAEWTAREQRWLDMYRKQKEIPGESLLQCVGPSEEWCFEAYAQTNYTKLKPGLFLEALVKNLAYSAGGDPEICQGVQVTNDMPLEIEKWREFNFSELFDITGGKGNLPSEDLRVPSRLEGSPVASSYTRNNGIKMYTSEPPQFSGHRLTITRISSCSRFAFYQQFDFCATTHVKILTAKFSMTPLAGLFLTVILNQESARFSYLRCVTNKRCSNMTIRLPANAKGQPDCQYMDTYMRRLRIASPN